MERTRLVSNCVVGAVWLGTVAMQVPRMSLDQHIQQLIGRDATVDCGTFRLGGAYTPEDLFRALACRENAIREHQAYRIVHYLQGEDSEIAFGVVHLRDGMTGWFDYHRSGCPKARGQTSWRGGNFRAILI